MGETMVMGYQVKVLLNRDEVTGITKKSMGRAVDLSSMELKRYLAINSPVDEGKLQGSWSPVGKVSELQRKIKSSAKYAKDVNDGTPPHVIKVKRAKALFVPMTGTYLGVSFSGHAFFKKVNHPGTKPTRFVEKSMEQTGKRSDEFIIRAVMETSGSGR
jgi:hypothetical protein